MESAQLSTLYGALDISDSNGFEHKQLDTTTNSIRLLRILPGLSKNGLIQCDLWHTTTNAEFSCLSYVWGEEIYEQPILINGKSFICRTNLWNFLQLVRNKFLPKKKVFWIDAICIDQSSISERNHQVGLMGGIYSKAIEVLAWFGPEDKTKVFLDLLRAVAAEEAPVKDTVHRMWHSLDKRDLRQSYAAFESNKYWTRAWITQEILLAPKFIIMTDERQIGAPEFSVLAVLFSLLKTTTAFQPVGKSERHRWVQEHRFQIYIGAMPARPVHHYPIISEPRPDDVVRSASQLLDLLFNLGPRECQVGRDRVYSLLAIVEDGSRVKVDYGLPEHVFIASLLTSYVQWMCLCSVARLIDVLDCVEPFRKTAPQSLLVQLSLKDATPLYKTRYRTGSQHTSGSAQKYLRCTHCADEIFADPWTEIVFCLPQVCVYGAMKGHLVVLGESGNGSSARIARLQHVSAKGGTKAEKVVTEVPISITSFEKEGEKPANTKSRLAEGIYYRIILPFETLCDLVMEVAEEK